MNVSFHHYYNIVTHVSLPVQSVNIQCLFFSCRMMTNCSPQDAAEFLYEEQPDMLKYRTATPSIETLAQWYQNRAEEIESYSRQVSGGAKIVLHV